MVGCSGVWVSAMQPPSANSPIMATIARMMEEFPRIGLPLLHTNRG
jgi:hypothetical protein